jgi:flagellar protein FliS
MSTSTTAKSSLAAAAPVRRTVDPYLRTRVMTASPEQLQLLLFDGAIRFAEQGKAALEGKRFDVSFDKLSRAQSIVGELQNGLRHDKDPETCHRLDALYTWCYMQLVEANVSHEVEKIDGALRVLQYQRETWQMLAKARTPTPVEEHPSTGGFRLAG